MDGIVAKRTLKKSYYDKNNIKINEVNDKKNYDKSKKSFKRYKEKIIYKLAIQSIIVISGLLFIFSVRILDIKIIKKADITKIAIKQCQKNYSASEIINQGKKYLYKTYKFIQPIIPKNIEKKIQVKYDNILNRVLKKKESTNKIVKEEVLIYEESSISDKENKKEFEKGLGTSVDNENKIVTASSAISSELTIAEKIKATNIKFIKPVSGVITSHFGAREVIFEGIDSYHTGTDIATKAGTKIVSSISGKVTKAEYNKYNGNFVEVTDGKVVTKYLHMSKLNVKKGESIKAGQKIGEVGSTGLATGPHLHFEIVYDGTKVDPELVLKL